MQEAPPFSRCPEDFPALWRIKFIPSSFYRNQILPPLTYIPVLTLCGSLPSIYSIYIAAHNFGNFGNLVGNSFSLSFFLSLLSLYAPMRWNSVWFRILAIERSKFSLPLSLSFSLLHLLVNLKTCQLPKWISESGGWIYLEWSVVYLLTHERIYSIGE